MAKPTVPEIQELLNVVMTTYDELDMRLKSSETHYERYRIGDKVFKVGFTFDDEDNMTIRIVDRTPNNE